MKTKNACFWIFLLLSGSAYAQMSQKGTVQILIQISPHYREYN